jgi:hypothetical protein
MTSPFLIMRDLHSSSSSLLLSFSFLSPSLPQYTSAMDPDEEVEGPPPRFIGDDPRPTSKKELAGWYCYGWAAEVFTVCAMGT